MSSFWSIKTALRWTQRTINNNSQAYEPLLQGNGTGWRPEEDEDSSLLSSDMSFPDLDRASATQTSLPPISILNGKYTYISTIVKNLIHLYQSARGEQIIVKSAPAREAKIHRQLAGPSQYHPNLVRYIDTTTLNGKPINMNANSDLPEEVFLLMEFSNSGSWQSLVNHAIAHNHVLPAAFCFHVLRSVIDGLTYMQESHGLLHTDAHLGNVTFDVTQEGTVRCLLIDFEAALKFYPGELVASSFSLTAQEMMRCRKAFPEEVLRLVALAVDRKIPGRSENRMREFRDVCLREAGKLGFLVSDMPDWLAEYFDWATLNN